jgi:ribosomal protein S18 acetylase RimI-like enzyme
MAEGERKDMKEFIQASSDTAIKKIASLADAIWREHYTVLIGEKQVSYMLDKYQSFEVVKEQIKNNGYEYYIISDGWDDCGYFAVVPRGAELYISKLYVNKQKRGAGIGRMAVAFIETLAKKSGFSGLTLNVNKRNSNSIEAYKKFGFGIIKEENNDIGEGFFMDDFVMSKKI